MSAETLRKAARLIRERAEACLASDDQWYEPNELLEMLRSKDADSNAQPLDAAHIASWHPAVALAVADWLEKTTSHADTYPDRAERVAHALAVARAYLEATS